MAKRELQFTNGKSEKLWTITLKGDTHTVVYGRIGTVGRTLSKSFDTSSEAKASYESLIAAKLRKGYGDASPKKKRAAKKRPATKAKKKSTLSATSSKKRTQSSGDSADTGIALNDLTRRINMHHCLFRDARDMADHCHYVLNRLFLHIRVQDPWVDVAVWEIGPTVLVRPACPALDESHRSFVRPLPIYFDVKGYKHERRKVQRQKNLDASTIEEQLQALESELMQRMQNAIVKGFERKAAQKSYTKYNPENRPFTILITPQDKGLHASDFTVVWKNRRGATAAQIRKQAAAVKGKKPKIAEQGESSYQQNRKKLSESRKKEREAARKYWQREKEKWEKRKPAVRKQLAAQIAQAEERLAKQTKTTVNRKAASKRSFLLSLDDGNQHERLLAPAVKLDKLVEIVATYKWSDAFNEYDNRMWEYMYALIDPLRAKTKLSHRALWDKLNRVQKVFYVLLDFNGETDNGGVWQFLFNSPEFSLAALEAMNEIGAKNLARDYQATLEEFMGKARSLSDLRKRFDDKNLNSEKQWQAFAEGYQELTTAKTIQKYFFTPKFKKTLFKQMSDYIEESYHLFAKIKM